MTDRRRQIGGLGEQVAVGFLRDHGLRIVARNVGVHGGELDILAVDGSRRVAVEVRTVTGREDPLGAFGPAKAAQVARLAKRVGAHRVDLVAVRIDRAGADVRWVKGAA